MNVGDRVMLTRDVGPAEKGWVGIVAVIDQLNDLFTVDVICDDNCNPVHLRLPAQPASSFALTTKCANVVSLAGLTMGLTGDPALCSDPTCNEDIAAKVKNLLNRKRASAVPWRTYVLCSKGHKTMVGRPSDPDPGIGGVPVVEMKE